MTNNTAAPAALRLKLSANFMHEIILGNRSSVTARAVIPNDGDRSELLRKFATSAAAVIRHARFVDHESRENRPLTDDRLAAITYAMEWLDDSGNVYDRREWSARGASGLRDNCLVLTDDLGDVITLDNHGNVIV